MASDKNEHDEPEIEDTLEPRLAGTAASSPGVRPLLVLGKIRSILDAFSLERPELSLTELRYATGFPASTVQRLAMNMVTEGFLDRHGDVFRVGVSMAYWAAPATQGLDLIEVVSPILRQLRDQCGETVCLFRLERNVRVCVAMAETRHAIRREMHVGKILPLHAGSAGRVLLAWDEAAAERVLEADLTEWASNTVTDPDRLRQLIRETRSAGYAMTQDERDDGATGLSAPVFDAAGQVLGALNISGPTLRISAAWCEQWIGPLLAAAAQTTRLMGGRLPG